MGANALGFARGNCRTRRERGEEDLIVRAGFTDIRGEKKEFSPLWGKKKTAKGGATVSGRSKRRQKRVIIGKNRKDLDGGSIRGKNNQGKEGHRKGAGETVQQPEKKK